MQPQALVTTMQVRTSTTALALSCLGCTDSAAADYNPEATVDSGDCVYCDPGTFILSVDMADSFGDGWNGAGYGIFGDAGTIYEGSLDSAFIGDGLTSGTDLICLAPGCYSFQTTSGAAAGEISVTLSDEFGTTYGTIGGGETYGVDFTLTGQCDISGCTNCCRQLQPICEHRRWFL